MQDFKVSIAVPYLLGHLSFTTTLKKAGVLFQPLPTVLSSYTFGYLLIPMWRENFVIRLCKSSKPRKNWLILILNHSETRSLVDNFFIW